jgi:hypothetical protein
VTDRVAYCTGCGQPPERADHARCDIRRRFEPPRYCPQCGRRMVVKVTPMAWTATCSRHGVLAPDTARDRA